MTQPIAKSLDELAVFKIDPSDSNYFACIADPVADGAPFLQIIEIYEVGGATPPNTHKTAYELFYILAGTGRGICDGVTVDLAPGSTLLIPPGKEHVVENTGTGKLYAITTMVPNEDFAELIHSGHKVSLDAEDRRVLSGLTP
ncbi:MAG: cupin domain-containing protein [Pseudomonadota bacterium]